MSRDEVYDLGKSTGTIKKPPMKAAFMMRLLSKTQLRTDDFPGAGIVIADTIYIFCFSAAACSSPERQSHTFSFWKLDWKAALGHVSSLHAKPGRSLHGRFSTDFLIDFPKTIVR